MLPNYRMKLKCHLAHVPRRFCVRVVGRICPKCYKILSTQPKGFSIDMTSIIYRFKCQHFVKMTCWLAEHLEGTCLAGANSQNALPKADLKCSLAFWWFKLICFYKEYVEDWINAGFIIIWKRTSIKALIMNGFIIQKYYYSKSWNKALF